MSREYSIICSEDIGLKRQTFDAMKFGSSGSNDPRVTRSFVRSLLEYVSFGPELSALRRSETAFSYLTLREARFAAGSSVRGSIV